MAPATGEEGGTLCQVCTAVVASVYCRNDSAMLCTTCDTSIHGRNPLAARHWRVQLCELCEREPATVYCRQVRLYWWGPPPSAHARAPQDAASLCDACSKEIHEANPLAGRHVLEAVQPFCNSSLCAGAAAPPFSMAGTRVAASASAVEIEEYRRQCEALLSGEEAAETAVAAAKAPAAAPSRARADAGGAGSGTTQVERHSTSVAEGGLGKLGGPGGAPGQPADPFDALFGADFAELDSAEPLEFAFLNAHGARGARGARVVPGIGTGAL